MLGVLAFLIGASVGSFLNVVADRLPAGRSLLGPKSFCEACDRTLSYWELVPVLSYLVLRGRCRSCGTAIPVRFVLVELLTGILYTLVYLRYGMGTEFVVISVAISFMVVVALIDLERGLILNRLVYPSVVALILLSPFWSELGLSRAFLGDHNLLASVMNSLLAGLGAFLVFFAISLVYPDGMGGGDVKLAGVVGLTVGFPGVLLALWLAAVTGGLVAILLLVLRKRGRKDPIPFGPFLSLGAVAVLLAGSDIVYRYQDVTALVLGPWV